jgi:hypothetical protein
VKNGTAHAHQSSGAAIATAILYVSAPPREKAFLHAAFELPQLFNRSPEEHAPISLDKDTYLDKRRRKLERQDKETGAISFTLKRKRHLGGEENDGETDRDPKIPKAFWKTLARRLNLKHSLTAAWHAQTDGAAERLNQTLETAIRAYVSPQLDIWHESLSMLELAYNTAKNASTGMSPFDLLYVQPHNVVERLMGISDRQPDNNLDAQDFLEMARNRL